MRSHWSITESSVTNMLTFECSHLRSGLDGNTISKWSSILKCSDESFGANSYAYGPSRYLLVVSQSCLCICHQRDLPDGFLSRFTPVPKCGFSCPFRIFTKLHRINRAALSIKSILAVSAGFVAQIWHTFYLVSARIGSTPSTCIDSRMVESSGYSMDHSAYPNFRENPFNSVEVGGNFYRTRA